jgi:hypothetical protein
MRLMTLRPRLLALCLLLATAPIPAVAQEAELSPLIEALEVVAKPPGPAMWRVRRGESEVVILGIVAPVPHLLTWDDRRLRRAITGASAVLIPARPTGGGKALLSYMFGGAGRLKSSAPLAGRLPADLAQRFTAAAAAAHQPMKRYDAWKPVVAGVTLMGDFDEAAGLSRAKPVSTVVRLAKTLRAPVKTAGTVDVAKLMTEGGRLDDAQNIACLAVALDDVERLAAAPGQLGEAWAKADLRAVDRLYTPQTDAVCPLLNPLLDRQIADTATQLGQALGRPGRTVALVDLTLLLKPGGVLDRLAATGAAVDTP